MNNPIALMRMIRNPQEFMRNAMQNQQVMQNPMNRNALQMAMNKDEDGLMKLARNMCKTAGVDFDTEFEKFKSQIPFN